MDPTVQNYAAPMQGFAYQDYHGINLLCRQSTDNQRKIVILEALISDTIALKNELRCGLFLNYCYDEKTKGMIVIYDRESILQI
jgi:hypothetical protein